MSRRVISHFLTSINRVYRRATSHLPFIYRMSSRIISHFDFYQPCEQTCNKSLELYNLVWSAVSPLTMAFIISCSLTCHLSFYMYNIVWADVSKSHWILSTVCTDVLHSTILLYTPLSCWHLNIMLYTQLPIKNYNSKYTRHSLLDSVP